jgi:hypothetical protein
VLCAIAAYSGKKFGLLALACEAQGRPPPSSAGRWLCLLAHFKFSFAVLLASLAVGWWARVGLVLWVVDPAAWPWRPSVHASDVHFGLQGPPWLLVTLGVAWLPVVPFLASDVWRLLRPLMVPRAARLHLPFAIASVVLALGAVLLIRHHALVLFSMFGLPTRAALL